MLGFHISMLQIARDMSNGKKLVAWGIEMYKGDYTAQLQYYNVSSCFLMVRDFATVTGPLGSQASDFVQLTSLASTNWLCHAVPMGPNTWEVAQTSQYIAIETWVNSSF